MLQLIYIKISICYEKFTFIINGILEFLESQQQKNIWLDIDQFIQDIKQIIQFLLLKNIKLMDQQIKLGKAIKYPPMDNMSLFETDEQITIKSLVEKIHNLIPNKFCSLSKQTPLTTDPLQPTLLTILEAIKAMVGELTKEQPTEQSETTSLKENDQAVSQMKEMLQTNQFKAKKIQVKLLGTIKKLNQEIKQKELMMDELKKIVQERQIELESMHNMNEKKYRQIRQLQEDVYDIEEELNKKTQQLENEQKYTIILQMKLEKLTKSPKTESIDQKQLITSAQILQEGKNL